MLVTDETQAQTSVSLLLGMQLQKALLLSNMQILLYINNNPLKCKIINFYDQANDQYNIFYWLFTVL